MHKDYQRHVPKLATRMACQNWLPKLTTKTWQKKKKKLQKHSKKLKKLTGVEDRGDSLLTGLFSGLYVCIPANLRLRA